MIKTEASINGEVILFLIPSTDLDREILKTIKPDSKITIVSVKGAQFHGKAVPEGTIVISPKDVKIDDNSSVEINIGA
jgi:hypothetical protein